MKAKLIITTTVTLSLWIFSCAGASKTGEPVVDKSYNFTQQARDEVKEDMGFAQVINVSGKASSAAVDRKDPERIKTECKMSAQLPANNYYRQNYPSAGSKTATVIACRPLKPNYSECECDFGLKQ